MRSSFRPRSVLVVALALLGGARPAAAVVSAPVLKWTNGGCFSSWCQTGWYSSPAVADLDGDGSPDVIWGSYDVVSLNGATGALKWRGPNASRVEVRMRYRPVGGKVGQTVASLLGADPERVIDEDLARLAAQFRGQRPAVGETGTRR